METRVNRTRHTPAFADSVDGFRPGLHEGYSACDIPAHFEAKVRAHAAPGSSSTR